MSTDLEPDLVNKVCVIKKIMAVPKLNIATIMRQLLLFVFVFLEIYILKRGTVVDQHQ